MYTVVVERPADNAYPFSRELFEERSVIYHGTWSTCCPRIESEGLLSGADSLDVWALRDINDAHADLGNEAFFAGFDYFNPFTRREVFFTPSFWGARAYATDGGGEVVRKTIEDADRFLRICDNPDTRRELIESRKTALREYGSPHARTEASIVALEDETKLQCLRPIVEKARLALVARRGDGFPVVYAIRADADWFGDTWERHLYHWREMETSGGELKCFGFPIGPERLIARADFPNGTDQNFMPDHVTTWEAAEKIALSC